MCVAIILFLEVVGSKHLEKNIITEEVDDAPLVSSPITSKYIVFERDSEVYKMWTSTALCSKIFPGEATHWMKDTTSPCASSDPLTSYFHPFLCLEHVVNI